MTRPARARVFLALLALPALAGCFGRASRSDYGLGPAREAVPVPPGRRCEYLTSPEALPPLDRVLGLGFLGNLGLWGYGGSDADTLELSVRYGHDGRLDWVRPVRRVPPGSRLDELQRITRHALPEQVRGSWGFRLFITGDGRAVAILPSVICEAQVLSTSHVARPIAASPGDRAEMDRARGRTFEVEVVLDADGRILGARLPRTTGSLTLDQYMLDVVRATRFSPFLHDGLAVGTVQVFRLTIPRRA